MSQRRFLSVSPLFLLQCHVKVASLGFPRWNLATSSHFSLNSRRKEWLSLWIHSIKILRIILIGPTKVTCLSLTNHCAWECPEWLSVGYLVEEGFLGLHAFSYWNWRFWRGESRCWDGNQLISIPYGMCLYGITGNIVPKCIHLLVYYLIRKYFNHLIPSKCSIQEKSGLTTSWLCSILHLDQTNCVSDNTL